MSNSPFTSSTFQARELKIDIDIEYCELSIIHHRVGYELTSVQRMAARNQLKDVGVRFQVLIRGQLDAGR